MSLLHVGFEGVRNTGVRDVIEGVQRTGFPRCAYGVGEVAC